MALVWVPVTLVSVIVSATLAELSLAASTVVLFSTSSVVNSLAEDSLTAKVLSVVNALSVAEILCVELAASLVVVTATSEEQIPEPLSRVVGTKTAG